jgi:hypothetical protein
MPSGANRPAADLVAVGRTWSSSLLAESLIPRTRRVHRRQSHRFASEGQAEELTVICVGGAGRSRARADRSADHPSDTDSTTVDWVVPVRPSVSDRPGVAAGLRDNV